MAGQAVAGQVAAGQVAAGRAVGDPVVGDPVVGDPVVAELAAADKVGGRGRVGTDPLLIDLGLAATAPNLIVPVREATGHRSTDLAAKATVRLSIARSRPPTCPRSIARGGTARHRLIVRG
ncbi:MAG: hypothetical protein ACR2H0_00945, partial [Candidatus Limnocylindrales bacterium]